MESSKCIRNFPYTPKCAARFLSQSWFVLNVHWKFRNKCSFAPNMFMKACIFPVRPLPSTCEHSGSPVALQLALQPTAALAKLRMTFAVPVVQIWVKVYAPTSGLTPFSCIPISCWFHCYWCPQSQYDVDLWCRWLKIPLYPPHHILKIWCS